MADSTKPEPHCGGVVMADSTKPVPHRGPSSRFSYDLAIGLDVGSTTCKAVVVDPESRAILWSRYERHETRQAETLHRMLINIGQEFCDVQPSQIRTFITGSGAGPIAPLLGSRFVQEVNAVTLAVEQMHPDVGSVVELGGQDAKIIIFKVDPKSGKRHAITSMNDKCASGTGATIDKCVIKVGMRSEDVVCLPFSDERLHHVAAKCGVFAETDIVNLIKSGIPAAEVLCSLADAIVMQNLSVLARGNTLRHKVLLLGGPNTYLPWLRDCWRKRIPETWRDRGYEYPIDMCMEELIPVPANAQYYAAYGAVIYGLHEAAEVGRYLGLDRLTSFMREGRAASLKQASGPPLVDGDPALDSFQQLYRLPSFEPVKFPPGTVIEGYVGLDGGSTSSKAVLIDKNRRILSRAYQLSRGNPIQDTKDIMQAFDAYAREQKCTLKILGFGATGYAADVLEETVLSDVNVVETVAHMLSATHYFPDVDVICDIGGQDIKVLFMQHGDIKNFRLSNQCSAGNGMLLQAMADQFGVRVQEYADIAFAADLSPNFSYGCAVFLDADRVNFQKEGYNREQLLAGLAMVLPKNVWQYVVQVPRLAELGRRYVLQGGTQYNLAALKAQVDYIAARVPHAEIRLHPYTGEAGALGAAFEAARVVEKRGFSTFIGLESAIGMEFTTQNDEATRCHFCPNECSRTFIDTSRPDGGKSRYIAGFSCEKGTVESKEALQAITRRRRDLKNRYPNLVEYEAKLAFRRFYEPEPLPEAHVMVDDVTVSRRFFGLGKVQHRPIRRPFERSGPRAEAYRQGVSIGMPRVLNFYTIAPLLRTYFETVGIQESHIVFSDYTSEEMWLEGGKYGSVDPCYPSKVVQAHLHNLLMHKHKKSKLDYIFFPCLTHVQTWVDEVMDSASCPVVAGTPKVMRAAFTKERDYFAERQIDYVDASIQLTEPNYFKKQMFEIWGERLQLTQDESDFACDQGFKAFELFDREMQRRGLEIMNEVEAAGRVAVLLLARPYHNDPGLNHGILEEFQALGYPILSMRSIPRDDAWLSRFFREDLKQGIIKSPRDIRDVWPENYSTNSAQKVWAAKVAARHPNLVVLDLSSFKCGHDAPTYGLIDSIIKEGKKPYSALHDIDANKPSGSIKIRVRTYAHALKRHEEALTEQEKKKDELRRSVDQKRRELYQEFRLQLQHAILRDPKLRAEMQRLDDQFNHLLEEGIEPAGPKWHGIEPGSPVAPSSYLPILNNAPTANDFAHAISIESMSV